MIYQSQGWKYLVLLVNLLLPFLAFAQQAFSCFNDFYLTLGVDGDPIDIFRMEIDEDGTPIFNPFSTAATQIDINAIGYRSTDNLIYGINPGSYQLYRIDASGNTTPLGTPAGASLSGEYYYAGDVTPDGKYLVIIGLIDGRSRSMAHIDLESPDYTATRINLSGEDIAVADLAFDPFTGLMYSFDGRRKRLVTIDPETGFVQAPFPQTTTATMMGALFFDVFGQLWGYGRSPEDIDQRSLFQLNKITGEVTLVSEGPISQRNDGCSCPYTLKLREWIDLTETVPCSEINMVIEIANASGQARTDLLLTHSFPAGLQILAIDNPLSATMVNGGVGTNYLELQNLAVPLGLHQIKVRLETLPGSEGIYLLQSELSNLPAVLGESTFSDNPFTLQQDDPLQLIIIPLAVDFSEVENRICPDGSLLLDAGLAGVDYLWSDGSTASTFEISDPGTYSVTVSSACETVIETIQVTEWPLEVLLGPDQILFLGDSLHLTATTWPPEVHITRWEWAALDPEEEICQYCPGQSLQPLFDAAYEIQVGNVQGCTARDTIHIQVTKDYQVYLPNVFSPNYDGWNDWFYPQSRQVEQIKLFQIFDRWGNMVFDRTSGQTNIGPQGWDGNLGSRPAPNGTYLYLLEVLYLDGVTRHFSGGVSIVR